MSMRSILIIEGPILLITILMVVLRYIYQKKDHKKYTKRERAVVVDVLCKEQKSGKQRLQRPVFELEDGTQVKAADYKQYMDLKIGETYILMFQEEKDDFIYEKRQFNSDYHANRIGLICIIVVNMVFTCFSFVHENRDRFFQEARDTVIERQNSAREQDEKDDKKKDEPIFDALEDDTLHKFEEPKKYEGGEEGDGYYSVCTELSKEEVEAFAKQVKEELLAKDLPKLAEKIAYPIVIDGVTYEDASAFENEKVEELLSDENFYESIEAEECVDLFCNYQGIMMGEGQVWIAQVEGEDHKKELKIIALQ